ncbi:MAG: hypothetical protein NXH97_03270 [Rhodobacteraceae bacterium]|nr:hypothetical protein [Paracoccaceae bacterium]
MQSPLPIPVLINAGVTLEVAHLLTFYFVIMSAIAPPVAIGPFVANALSGAKLWLASSAAFKPGPTGYIVHVMFVYSPALILQGTTFEIVAATVTAIPGALSSLPVCTVV